MVWGSNTSWYMHLIRSLNAFYILSVLVNILTSQCEKSSKWLLNAAFWTRTRCWRTLTKLAANSLDKEQVLPFTSDWDDVSGFIFGKKEDKFLLQLSNYMSSYERHSTVISSCYWKSDPSAFTKNTAARATFLLQGMTVSSGDFTPQQFLRQLEREWLLRVS